MTNPLLTKPQLRFSLFSSSMAVPPIATVSSTAAAAVAQPGLCCLLPLPGLRSVAASKCPLRPTTTMLVTTDRIRTSYPTNQRDVRSAAVAFSADGAGTVFQDAGATVVVVGGAYALVSAFDYLTRRQIIEQSLSRKLVHILSGLLYMGCWPVFSTSTEARYFAALVPLLNSVRLLLHGLSLVSNDELVKSVTREGKPEELLRGPLYYVLVLILCSLVFWRDSPVGVVSLAMMCGGDGIADIVGRRLGFHKLPYNNQKSWAGSISMFLVGFVISIGMLYYFSAFGYFKLDWVQAIERVALVALVATLVESLPTKGGIDDNISVPLASMVTAYLTFGY